MTKDDFGKIFNRDKTNISFQSENIKTLENKTTYIDNEDVSLLISTIFPENTVEERTKINLLENLFTRKSITSNHESNDKLFAVISHKFKTTFPMPVGIRKKFESI